MTNILDEIVAKTRDHVANQKLSVPLHEVEQKAKSASPPRGFLKNLQHAGTDGFGLIAEVKKASPSKGLIRADFDPALLAQGYEAGGATCVSVLTDEPYFKGKPEYLIAARDAISLPVLRKDFMIDLYQIPESRAMGADCILIIMAALDDQLAKDLEQSAIDWGMDVLVEVHNIDELDRALRLQSPLIGINNRNLTTLEVSLQTTVDLADKVPEDRLLISESGLNTADDLARMAHAGAKGFLIGESLMRQADVEIATRELLQSARKAA